MADPISDLIRQLGSGSPIIGAPGPNYGIVNTGDQSIDLMLSQLLMGAVGPGKFLPQQFPAQNLLDQMVSSKYATSTKAMTNRLRGDGFTAGTDNAAVFERLKGIRSRFDNTPLTPLGEAQLRNSAQYVNNDLTQALLSATMGPQAMEDLFFGQRGSKEMLGRSAANIGFYRPDAITGHGRMTEKSLETFTDQVYSNLYGPDADLNDISGFSAGRTGTIMQDLARRGLLPASMSKLTTEERRRSIKNNADDIEKLNLPSNITEALNDDKTFEEIAEMPGGADSIRKIDATRVSNSLKEYTKAISTVREIFGDNGMSDAPMGQLLAAMEALTQNSMGSMAPGKLENLMRRTQMAARDSGVSLEGLLGLTARAGAVADQNGLAREYAPDAVVSAMERTKALRDNGGFVPGFGRVDADKATLAMVDQNVRADASPVARLVSVAQRAIKENLLNPAVKGGDDQLKALVNAIGSGQTMMYDPATNKQIDIYKELGRNPDAFLKPMFDAAGITPELASSLYNSPGTAEYLREMQGRQFHLVQSGEIKARLAQQITASGRFGGAMSNVSDADRESLNSELSQTFARTAIDVVSTQMKPEERTAAYKDAIRNVFIRRAFSVGGVDPGNMVQATEYANNEMGRFFGGDEKLNQLVGARAGEIDAHLNGLFPGLTLSNAQQYYSERATQDGAKIHRANMSRINLFDNLRGPGSNPYQRLSDYLVSGEGSAMDAILGTVDKGSVVDKIKDSMQAGDAEKFDETYKELINAKNALYVDTPEERNKSLKAAASGELSAVIDQFKDTAVYEELKGKTTYKTNAQVAQDIKTRIGADGKAATDAAELFASRIAKNGEKFTASDEQLNSLAALENIHGALGLEITPETITESQLKTFLDTTRAFNISSDSPLRADMIKRDAAFDSYNRSLRDGNFKSKDILGMVGVSDAIASNENINKTFAGFLENGEDKQAENLREQLRDSGASEQQVEKIISTGRASYALKREGGLDSINAANASEYNAMTSRSMAVLNALGDEDGKGRMLEEGKDITRLARLHAKGELKDEKDKKRFKEIFSDPKAYEEAVTDAALRTPEHGDSKAGTTAAVIEDAKKREKSLLPTELGALAGSLGGGLASVGTGIATAIKEAFNGEVTIQTAKIEKLDIQLGDIAATIASTMLSAATPQARDGTMSGTMQIAGDFKTAIMNVIDASRPALEFPPGVDGAPIHPTV